MVPPLDAATRTSSRRVSASAKRVVTRLNLCAVATVAAGSSTGWAVCTRSSTRSTLLRWVTISPSSVATLAARSSSRPNPAGNGAVRPNAAAARSAAPSSGSPPTRLASRMLRCMSLSKSMICLQASTHRPSASTMRSTCCWVDWATRDRAAAPSATSRACWASSRASAARPPRTGVILGDSRGDGCGEPWEDRMAERCDGRLVRAPVSSATWCTCASSSSNDSSTSDILSSNPRRRFSTGATWGAFSRSTTRSSRWSC
mmetsp:Transcript_51584/g.113091  ORF Transcript_51584/g.113091 Transcript_51584/m.113091 type:complete len:259 (-) Transcript_51584:1246-2022(-)